MAKTCVVHRNEDGVPEVVLVKKPNIQYNIQDLRGTEYTQRANYNIKRLQEYVNFRKLQERKSTLENSGTRLRRSQEDLLKNSEFNDKRNLFIDLGYPTRIISNVLNPNLPIQVSMEYLYNHVINRNDNRNISENDIAEITRAIHNPILIYKNQEDNNTTRTNRYELYTDLKNSEGKNIIFVVESDRTAFGEKDAITGKKQQFDYNTIVTGFSDNNNSFSRFVGAIQIPSDIIFMNKERIAKVVQGDAINTKLLDLTYDSNSGSLNYNLTPNDRNYNANIKRISEFSKSFLNKIKTTEVLMNQYTNNQISNVPKEILGAVTLKLKSTRLVSKIVEKTTEEIEQQLNTQEELLRTPSGFYNPQTKEIWLDNTNPNILETTLHEFGHAYMDWLRESYPDHLIAGKALIDFNTKEAQPYIDIVNNTQPNLVEGSDAWKEEVLAQIIGDNGAKLVVSKSNNSVAQWLQDLWNMFKDMVGLTSYTADEVSNMTLKQFADAVNADMLNNTLAKYSLSVLENSDFKALRGKQVKAETIRQYLNKTGIKQIEKDIINDVLKQDDFNKEKRFDYDIFERAVKLQIMPLSKILSDSYSNYGSENVGLDDVKSTTIIFNSPVDHNLTSGYHFTDEHQLYRQADTSNMTVEVIDDDSNASMKRTILKDENGNILLSKKGVHDGTYMKIIYATENATEIPLTQGSFGHIRVWEDGKTYYISEIQSDVFQKSNLITIQGNNTDSIVKQLRDEIDIKYVEKFKEVFNTDFVDYKEGYIFDIVKNFNKIIDDKRFELNSEKAKFNRLLDQVRNNRDYEEIQSKLDSIDDEFIKFRKEQHEKYLKFESEYNSERDNIYKQAVDLSRSNIDKQFIASDKFNELRMIREGIKDAANRGFSTVRLPLPHTLSTIEGHLGESQLVNIEGTPQLGQEVNYMDENNIIVDFDLADDKVRVVPSDRVEIESLNYAFDNYVEDIFNNIDYLKDVRIQISDLIQQLEDKNIRGYRSVEESLLRQYKEDTIVDFDDISSEVGDIIKDNTSNQDLINYWAYEYHHVFINNNSLYRTSDYGENVHYGSTNSLKEEYSIDSLPDFYQPVAKRYERIGKILSKERGSNFQIITDKNGYDWYETDITDADKTNPVLAFQILPENVDTDLIDNKSLELAKQLREEQLSAKTDQEGGFETDGKGNIIGYKETASVKNPPTNRQIKEETGWEFNENSQTWEYEINDGKFNEDKFYELQEAAIGRGKTAESTMEEVWEHPEIYEIFPEFSETKIIFEDLSSTNINRTIDKVSSSEITKVRNKILAFGDLPLTKDHPDTELRDWLLARTGEKTPSNLNAEILKIKDPLLQTALKSALKGNSKLSIVAQTMNSESTTPTVKQMEDIMNVKLPSLLKKPEFAVKVKLSNAHAVLDQTSGVPILKINKSITIGQANRAVTHEIQHYIQTKLNQPLGGSQHEYPLGDIRRRMDEIYELKIKKDPANTAYYEAQRKKFANTDPRDLRKIYYRNLAGEVQSRLVEKRYEYNDSENKILFSRDIDIDPRDIINKYDMNGELQASELFEELRNEPGLTPEDALNIYKEIYSKDFNHWESTNLNEC